MNPAEIRDYLEREWKLPRELKDRYWAERKRDLTPEAALRMGDGLRKHARGLRPDWPDAEAREADLRIHASVAESLRSVFPARR